MRAVKSLCRGARDEILDVSTIMKTTYLRVLKICDIDDDDIMWHYCFTKSDFSFIFPFYMYCIVRPIYNNELVFVMKFLL